MFKRFLDSLPSFPVIFLGSIFFIMPMLPEPHLWEKFMMIKDGLDMQPIDYFDIFIHAGAGFMALAKYLRDREVAKQTASAGPADDADQTRGNGDA